MPTTFSFAIAAIAIALVPQVLGHTQLFFQGEKFISGANDPTELSQDGLAGTLSALLNINPTDYVGSSVSQQMEGILLPTVFSRPEAVFSLQALVAPGDESSQYFLSENTAHSAAYVKADKIAASAKVLQALSSVVHGGVTSGAVEHLEFGKATSCSKACTEDLLKEALLKMGGNYTAASAALKGVAFIPEASRQGTVGVGLDDSAGLVWAVEMANLRQAAIDLAQLKQQQAGSVSVLYETTVISPKLLSEKYGATDSKTQAAVSALASVVNDIVKALKDVHDDRMVAHWAFLDDAPIRKNDVRGALQWHEQQQRRHLLAVPSVSASSDDSANSWFVQAAAYISALLLVVFAIASCQVLAKMQFKQDSLLYGRTKAE